MFTRLFGTPYEKLIGAIKAENELKARTLIAQMNITELSKVDNDGVTAVTLAARQGKRVEKICELLIPKMSDKAIIYQVNNSGYAAFICAANSGLGNICELLIPKMNKQAFNHVDKDGNTPLMCAANNYLDKVCELLFPKMNAQGINYINNEGNTALTIAADRELEKTCELLVNKMSNEAINQVTKDGNTVLTVAASKGLDKVCEALVLKMSEQAINSVIKDGFFKGHTALSIAKRHGFKNICALLETHQKQIFSENNELTETANKFLDQGYEELFTRIRR